EPLIIAVAKAIFDDQALSFDIPESVNSRPDRVNVRGRSGGGGQTENPDPSDLCRLLRTRRERPRCYRAAECSQQFPPSDGDCHTPLPCEVRKGNDTTPRACCPNSAAPGAGNTVPSRTVNVLAVFTPNDGSSPMGLPFVPPLAAFEYGGVRNLEHSGDGPNAKPLLS